MSSSPSDYTPRPVSSRTTYALGALAVVLIALIVFLVYRWSSGGTTEVRNNGYGSVHQAAVVVSLESDAIRLGRADAPKTIDIYLDPLCPACGILERRYGQEIAQKLDEGKLAVRYLYVDFLNDRSASKDYSTRAIAALQCVAEGGSGPVFAEFHDTLFTTRQPDEGSDLGNDELATIAAEAGATETARQCIVLHTRHAAAEAAAAAATKALTEALSDKAATPTVFDGDTKIDVNDSEWVQHMAP